MILISALVGLNARGIRTLRLSYDPSCSNTPSPSTMLSDYDYTLPEELIAQEPLADRASSRLLWLHNCGGILQGSQNGTPVGCSTEDKHATITHHKFKEITDIFRSGDLLIMNDTRVTALRLMGKKGICICSPFI
jgi:hypothetical protein